MMQITEFDKNYFAKCYNLLSKDDQKNLIIDCDTYLSTNKKPDEIFPPLMASGFFTKDLLKKPHWKNLTKSTFEYVVEYSKYLNIKLKFKSCWINKVENYGKEEIENRLYFHEELKCYSDNHYHLHVKDEIVSTVFYLKNTYSNHGTIIKLRDRSIILDGKENSLSIFNGQLFHAGLFAGPEITSIDPRYVIVMSFKS